MRMLSRLFSSFIAALAVMLPAAMALAQEAAAGGGQAAAGGIARPGDAGFIAVAVAFGIGLATFGGAFGQSRAAAAALEGISRNPNAADKVFVPMILGLAFIESLVLFTWVLMLLMMLKL